MGLVKNLRHFINGLGVFLELMKIKILKKML